MLPAQKPPTEEIYQPDWPLWVRQWVTVGLVIAGVYALTLLSPIITILITTFLLSFLIFVPARMLARRTALNYPVSVIIIFLIILAVIIILVLVLVPSIVNLLRGIGNGLMLELGRVQETIRAWDPAAGPYEISIFDLVRIDVSQYVGPIHEALVAESDAETQAAGAALLDTLPAIDVAAIFGTTTQIIGGLIGTVSGFFSTLFLGMFLSLLILLELPRYQNRVLTTASPAYQRELRLLGVKVMNVWQGFFRGQLLLCAVIGLVTFLQLTFMGISAALPLSLVVAVISLIPTIGGILALVPLAIVPLLQGSTVFTEMNNTTLALFVVGVNLIISQFIWNVVAPKIMGDAVALPLPAIIVGIIIGTALGGALGAFLIVPILGTIRVIVMYLAAKIMRRDPYPGEETPEVVDLNTI